MQEEKYKRDGTTFMVYIIEREGNHEDGDQVTILGSKILDARLKKCELGTRVKIIFLGKEMSGGGFEYRNFRVDKWKGDGVSTPQGAQTRPLDTRTPDRIAAERGEIATSPSHVQRGMVTGQLPAADEDFRVEAPPEKEEVDIRDIPF